MFRMFGCTVYTKGAANFLHAQNTEIGQSVNNDRIKKVATFSGERELTGETRPVMNKKRSPVISR